MSRPMRDLPPTMILSGDAMTSPSFA